MPMKHSYAIFVSLMLLGLILSGITPHDYFTWFLEVAPAIVALIVLSLTRNRFPMSCLAYVLILLHAWVLCIGGHYTYAEVPLFDWIKEHFHQERNNYDKVGHLLQGFVPAIVVREVLIRRQVVQKPSWLVFLCASVCLAISAVYELLEALVAILSGESADAFLGTQGYAWDTQTDMLCALIGALSALLLLSKMHDRSIRQIDHIRQS